jgi:hypothetical protein
MEFRNVRADEIECRVGSVSKTGEGFSLLLYKDARTDQNILDETVGAMNWQKHYELIDGQLFCTIEIWDSEKKQWVGKQDVGIESNTEAEKGRASDAQKRSGFAWGIGRELYTAPFIWISEGDPKQDKFIVETIEIVDKKIVALTIINKKTKEVVYSFGGKAAKTTKKSATKKVETKAEAPKEEAPKAETTAKKRSVGEFPSWIEILKICKAENLDARQIAKMYGLTGKTPEPVFDEALADLKASLEADRKGE